MKILVTGGTGMVGQGFARLKTNHSLDLVGSKDYNLMRSYEAWWMIKNHKPDAIVHLAAKVGGVKGNTNFVADFYRDNILINTNVLEAARSHGIKKVVSLLSTCVYPDNATYPLTPNQIHLGQPHQSNFGYASAKRMLDVHSRALRQQYGLKYITAIPNNLYGFNDNFDLEIGHVVPAIIRKIHAAKTNDLPPVFWGSGKPLREFTFADDIAKILLLLLEHYDEPEPINIGNPGEVSIQEVVDQVCKLMRYKGAITWDLTGLEGQYRKPSCNKVFKRLFPDFQYTDFHDGLLKTCDWFQKEFPNVKGF